MTRPNHWLRTLYLLGAGFLLLSVWSIYRATIEGSPVADPQYYQQGLHYSETAVRQQAADLSGWSTRIELTPDHLFIHLSDRRQQPVSSAKASLTLHGRQYLSSVRLPLREISPGSYGAPLPHWGEDPLTAELTMEHHGRLLQRRLLLSPPRNDVRDEN